MRMLMSGTIQSAPTKKVISNGSSMAVMRIKDDSTTPAAYASVTAFDGLAEAVLKLKAGESVSVSGKAIVRVFTPEGYEPRPSISITADQISTLKQRRTAPIPEPAPRKEKPVEKQQGDRNEAAVKKAIADMVRKQATTKAAQATGNCQQCGQPMGADGLCQKCPF